MRCQGRKPAARRKGPQMPDTMRYDSNGQPLGYGEPVDPSLYGQPDPYGQYPQQGYAPMPSPQEIYAQQQYLDPNQPQPYLDPNQMYVDPNQGMYGAQPVQPDPYGQYPQQGGYLDADVAAAPMPVYPETDPALAAQQPYLGEAAYLGQQMPGYGQQPQEAYPGMQQPYGQMPDAQHAPQQAPMGMPVAAPQQMPVQQMPPQQMPQSAYPQQAQPEPEPIMDKKAAKRAAKEQKRAAKQQAAPANLGPEPSSGKAMLCMILGILSVVFSLIPPIGIALGLVVRKLSGDYMAQGGRSPKADTGRIFATVGLVFSCIMLLVLIFLGIFIYAGMYGEGQARTWAVFYNNSPFGNLLRIPIPNPLA